MSNKLCQS